ncbi:TIGR02206 family membrane protein [soil metagenome]
MSLAGQFESYGSSHLTALGIFAIGAVTVIMAGRYLRASPKESVASRGFALVIAAVAIASQVRQLTPEEWNLQTSLPLQLCDLAWIFAVHALWTNSALSATVTYLWGVTLTSQGIFTPDLSADFPEMNFFMFWGMHLVIVWAALYLVVGLRILPTWRTFRQTVAITLVWAISTYAFNVVADTNYGFLNRLPKNPSLLDYLGQWPWYVVLGTAIIAAVWAALTWPWCRPAASQVAEAPFST